MSETKIILCESDAENKREIKLKIRRKKKIPSVRLRGGKRKINCSLRDTGEKGDINEGDK